MGIQETDPRKEHWQFSAGIALWWNLSAALVLPPQGSSKPKMRWSLIVTWVPSDRITFSGDEDRSVQSSEQDRRNGEIKVYTMVKVLLTPFRKLFFKKESWKIWKGEYVNELSWSMYKSHPGVSAWGAWNTKQDTFFHIRYQCTSCNSVQRSVR